jgi:hypothetical protein
VIWGNQEEEYFRAEDSTEIMRDLPVGQHKGWGWSAELFVNVFS